MLGKVGSSFAAITPSGRPSRRCDRTFRRILAEGGIAGVEGEIASVEDVFALQGDAYLREVEKAYLR